jgi:4-amino-4-deoxy-L-arabinose transferase
VGNIAVLDSLFSFFLTGTITAFYFASEAPPRSSKESHPLLLAGLSCGLAFLTKGFLAFAVPVLVVVPYLVWQGRWKDVFRMSWLPILMAVLVASPWSILIHLREPDFWRSFFWNEHIGRLMPDATEHNEPFWFYLKAAPGLFMPWAFLTPAAMAGIRGQFKKVDSQDRLIRLSICWLVLPFLFFSVASGKLLTYILPCFPPFAVLMTLGLLNDLRKEGRNYLFQWGVIVTGMLFGLVLLVLIYIQLFGYQGFRPYGQPWKAVMAVDAFALIMLFSFLSFKSRERTTKIVLLGFSPLLFFLSLNFILPDLTIEKKVLGILLERYSQDIGHDSIIIADENTATAVCWYLHRSDVYVLGEGGELNYGLEYEDATGRHSNIRSARDLIERNHGHISLIARVRNISRWRDQLPKPFFQDDSGPEGYVLWRY